MNLLQCVIQFLEFMGGSNLMQVSPNFLILMRFIRMNTVVSYYKVMFITYHVQLSGPKIMG